MFCPNCGNANQQANAYCRKCGGFLPDFSVKKKQFSFGGETPQEQIRTNLILNLMSAIVSIASALLLYATFWNRGGEFQIVFLIAAFLLAMGGWQSSTFFVGLKLKKHFNKRSEKTNAAEFTSREQGAFASAQTRELLNEANMRDVVPASVTENTTKHLSEKINRNSSQAEQQSDRQV